LALIVTAREISDVHTFLQNLIFIINIVSASCKRNDELWVFQVAIIEHLVNIGEIEMSKGVNQVGGLQRAKLEIADGVRTLRVCLVVWLLLRLKQPQQLNRLVMLQQQIYTGGAYY
jgi:hypothetical protein